MTPRKGPIYLPGKKPPKRHEYDFVESITRIELKDELINPGELLAVVRVGEKKLH